MNILSKFKKPILITLLLVLLFPLFARPAQAFFTPNATYPFQFWNAVFRTDEMNLQSFVYETYKATIMSVFTSHFFCLTCPPGEANFGTGALVSLSRMIAMVYDTPPASGVEYLAYLGRKLDLIPPAYAQTAGEGFSRLDVILPIWQAFRNIAYVFFVLILVFIGFAIMFRIKISPQAVISIQSAFPRIILGLVLITFSFAIVGLLVDLMLVISNLIITIFNGSLDIDVNAALLGIPINPPVTSALGLGWTMFAVGLLPTIAVFALLIVVGASTTIITTLIGSLGGPVGGTAGFLIGVAIAIIIGIIFIIALIKVLWSLLKAYINVILALIFSPFQILIGTIPGSPAIGSWFKNLLANLAVFPTILTLVYVSGYFCLWFINEIGDSLIGQIINLLVLHTVDPVAMLEAITTTLEDPASVLNIGPMIIFFFVSIGILLMTPKAADMIKAFMAGQPFGYGAAIGEAFGPLGLAQRYGQGPAVQFGGEYATDKLGVAGAGTKAETRWQVAEKILTGLGYRKP